MAKRSMFVGMDVHKETIDISIAQEGRAGEVRHYGVIAGDVEALAKVVRALRAPGRRLHFVDEAGPCGFGIYRHATEQGEACTVVSPSHIPKRSGDRIKTDRRDSNALARLHRAGESTIWRGISSAWRPVTVDSSRSTVGRSPFGIVTIGPRRSGARRSRVSSFSDASCSMASHAGARRCATTGSGVRPVDRIPSTRATSCTRRVRPRHRPCHARRPRPRRSRCPRVPSATPAR